VVALFTAPQDAGGLGYRALGDWSQRPDASTCNRLIEAAILRDNLLARGYSLAHVHAPLQKLEVAADVTGTTLYQANLRTYRQRAFRRDPERALAAMAGFPPRAQRIAADSRVLVTASD
jgi:hypothetical protein